MMQNPRTYKVRGFCHYTGMVYHNYMRTQQEIENRIWIQQGFIKDLEAELLTYKPESEDFADTYVAIRQHQNDILLLEWVLNK